MKNSIPASRNRDFTVGEPDLLLNFLFSVLRDQSKTTVKSFLSHKKITVNGKPQTRFDIPLVPGDQVGVWFDTTRMPFSHPMLRILYEDESVIVIDKASGLLSMSDGVDRDKTAYRILSDYVKRTDPRARIFILHRLDRDTSGVMMFARTPQVQEIMQHNWENMILERTYTAVVEGRMEQEEGIIRSYIAENSAKIVHTSSEEEGRLAITRYRVIKSGNGYSLLELELETGRKNQIRVHMQDEGHPVTGDKKYGAQRNPLKRLALHASRLCFVHPATRKEMRFESQAPGGFNALVKPGR